MVKNKFASAVTQTENLFFLVFKGNSKNSFFMHDLMKHLKNGSF